MTAQRGTIVSLDPLDALGWIELDDGGRVRFGGTALKGFTTTDVVGMRVEVQGTTIGYQGVPKAVKVVPLEPAPPPGAPAVITPARVSWPTFVREHPRWSDAIEASAAFASDLPSLVLPRHPLFGAWHGEICATAPIGVRLDVPTHRNEVRFEPTRDDCFAHGSLAFLDEPLWPTCGLCAGALEMCVQLSRSVMAGWVEGPERGLVVMFCFECGVRKRSDPHVGYVRLVEGRARVEGPKDWKSSSSGWLAHTQKVTPRTPTRMPPGASWYRYRAQRTPTTASSALLGFGQRAFDDLPAGADAEMFDELDVELDEWIDSSLPRGAPQPGGWGGACLGGVPSWDQSDQTPFCDVHGEMQLLLDYEGGQFLDGALHVFRCRDRACGELQFVAEF